MMAKLIRFCINSLSAALPLLLLFPSAAAGKPVSVCVSVVPQRYLVQQIGGDLVSTRVMVLPGASPATYEPRPGQMGALAKTDIYFAVGVGFERVWLRKISATNPRMKVVHTDAGIEKIPMADHHHAVGAGGHGADGDGHMPGGKAHPADAGSRDGLDPHIWLSPPLVKVQVLAITTALQAIDPAHGTVFEANRRRFVSRVDQLDGRLRELFAGRQGLQFMVFHPAWGYFAHAYGLEQVPIEIEGKAPKPAQLKGVIENARLRGIRIVFVQPQFSSKSARLVAAEIGGQVAFADPLAEDWMANLGEVAQKFSAALK